MAMSKLHAASYVRCTFRRAYAADLRIVLRASRDARRAGSLACDAILHTPLNKSILARLIYTRMEFSDSGQRLLMVHGE